MCYEGIQVLSNLQTVGPSSQHMALFRFLSYKDKTQQRIKTLRSVYKCVMKAQCTVPCMTEMPAWACGGVL